MQETIKSLREENEELKRVNSTKSDLISISAHELRTSISALQWILKMFIDGDLGKITSEQKAFIERGLDSSNRMLDLVNNLLSFNHADDLDIPFKMEEVDVTNIVDQTIFEFSGETNKKGVELIFLKPSKPLPKVRADITMIRVVFQNLIENAIKYSSENDKIFISLKHDEVQGIVEVAIRDTGIGIKKDEQNKVFDKFFRGSNAEKKDKLGSGLGLFTTKNIIEKHKGEIWFESNEGSGTTFFFTIPVF